MEDSEKLVALESEEQKDEALQLAENMEIEQEQKEKMDNEFVEKRNLLQKTKIVRQTWSIAEIYQKIKDKKLILDPDYQRRAIWGVDKKTAFIESSLKASIKSFALASGCSSRYLIPFNVFSITTTFKPKSFSNLSFAI